jgi:hypothetical protein
MFLFSIYLPTVKTVGCQIWYKDLNCGEKKQPIASAMGNKKQIAKTKTISTV